MTNNDLIALHDSPMPGNIPQDELKKSQDAVKSEQDTKEVDLVEWLKLLVKMIDGENHEEEMRRVRKVTKMMRYYRGEQRGFWSASTGEWVPINPDEFEPRDAAMLLINNQIRPQVKSLAKEWARSRSRLKVIPRGDTVELKGAARYATARLDSLQDKLMPESFRQREAKSAFLAGNYIRYTHYNKYAKGGMASVPKMEKFKSKVHDDFSWCVDCDAEFDQSNNGTCPECGSKSIQEQKGREQELTRAVKVEKIGVGGPDTRLVDVREVKVHLRARNIAQTPYLRRRQYMLVPVLKEKFPWANIKPVPATPIMKYIQETELAIGGAGSRSSLMNFEEYGIKGLGGMTEFVQLWIRPSLYFEYHAKDDVTLGNGEVIKKGEKFIERYPGGMYVAASGEELLDIKRELMEKYWSHGTYDALIESFWGDGLDDLIPMQEYVNEMQSLFVENIIYNASPKIIYNPFLIESAMLNNNPAEMVPMSRQARREDKPANAVYQMEGMSIARDVPEAMIKAVDDMRTMSGAHLAMQGSNDRSLTTATSMSLAREAGLALLGPPLALKSEVDVVWAYQVLNLTQEYWVDGVSDKLLGDYSAQEAKHFKQCNVEQDLEITVEAGSWIPRTEIEIRNDFLTYVTAGGLPLGFANPAVPYEIKQKAAELMRMPIDLDKLQPDIRNANIRIEQVQAAGQVIIDAGIISPEQESDEIVQMITADVPIDPQIDEHQIFIDTYRAWMKKDEGRFAPVIVADSVRFLIARHQEIIQQQRDEEFQTTARYAMAAQAMQGLVDTAQHADETKIDTEADVAKETAKAGAQVAGEASKNQAQKTADPLPLGKSSKPGGSKAAETPPPSA